MGIYKIQNLINGKVYIGQSVHIEKRWLEHSQKNKRSLISKAIQKYGKENFSFQILEECSQEQLNEKENYYIRLYNCVVPNGYNVVEYNASCRQNVFHKYDKITFQNIIADIKESQLSFREISEKYELDLSMIYYLNRGDFHHIDGETYPLREVKNLSKIEHYCVDCGAPIGKGAVRCIECSHKKQYKCEHPDRQTLKFLIRNKTFVAIGKEFGVSDNAVKKWCKKYGLPSKRKEIKSLTEDEWLNI